MFHDTPDGKTQFCIVCEIEERKKQGRKVTLLNKDEPHTCGKSYPQDIVKKFQEDTDDISANTHAALLMALDSYKQRLIERVGNLDEKDIRRESDEFDAGLKTMKDTIIHIIQEEI